MDKIASRRGLFPFKVKRGKEYKSHVELLMNTKEWEKTKYNITRSSDSLVAVVVYEWGMKH